MSALDPDSSWCFECLDKGKDEAEYVIDGMGKTGERVVWDEYQVDDYIGMDIVYQQRWKNGEPYVIVPGVKSSDEFYPQEEHDFDVNKDEKAIEVIPVPESYSEEVETFVESKDVKGEVDIVYPL
jgi:hypothetical protein